MNRTLHLARLATLFYPLILGGNLARAQFHTGVMCALGATTSAVSTLPTTGCGAGFNLFVVVYPEVGVMGPQANRSYLTGYITNDLQLPLSRPNKRHNFVPYGEVGYTRMFETGHALDYGVGIALPSRKDDLRSLLIEVRDYWTFANPSQHNPAIRVGWNFALPD